MTSHSSRRYVERGNATQLARAMYGRALQAVPFEGDEATDERLGGGGFVGRAAALQRLEELRLGCARGRGTSLLVCGDPGIGKSRLLRQFAAGARAAGMRTLSAHGHVDPDTPALWPFVQLLRALFAAGLP